LHGTTTGEDMFLSMCETMKELELPWTKLKRVTTDKAPSMIGKKTGLKDRIRQETDKQNPELHLSSTNSHSVENTEV
jgi:hypothetical protein